MRITKSTTKEEIAQYIEQANTGRKIYGVNISKFNDKEAWISWGEKTGEPYHTDLNQGIFVDYGYDFNIHKYYDGTHPKPSIITTLDGDDIPE